MADPGTLVLLGGAIVLLIVILAILIVRKPPTIRPETIASNVTQSIAATGLSQQIGEVRNMADLARQSAANLEELFRHPQKRGAAGEFQLEALLSDILPPHLYGVRQNVPGLGTPDAHVRTKTGIILVDAKFPLDAYRQSIETKDDAEHRKAQQRFARAVQGHVDKVAGYVAGHRDTVPFAIMFVPSEAVFSAALTQDPELLRRASQQGVMLASPTTFVAQLSILAAGFEAERLSASAQRIQEDLQKLRHRFETLGSEWSILKRHVTHAYTNLSTVDQSLEEAKTAWERAARPEP